MKKTKKLPIPTPDDILYGFAVTFDGTPQQLTEWKRRYPLWAPELEEIALAIMMPEGWDLEETDEEDD